jgi:hypothetical protein
VYASGERKITRNIPDASLISEVEYDLEQRWGRALFIDNKYIYKGYLTEERCLEIEAELAEELAISIKRKADSDKQKEVAMQLAETQEAARVKFKLKGDWENRLIWLNGNPLSAEASLNIRSHSPDGFAWGYSGGGPSQLALAIMLELYGEETAKKNYMNFKDKHIATLPKEDFDMEITAEGYNANYNAE